MAVIALKDLGDIQAPNNTAQARLVAIVYHIKGSLSDEVGDVAERLVCPGVAVLVAPGRFARVSP